jgi:hypothetical protein
MKYQFFLKKKKKLEELERFYSHLAFMSLSITDQCPVNTNILAPKAGALHTGPPNIKLRFCQRQL